MFVNFLIVLFLASSIYANKTKETLVFATLPIKKKSQTIEEFTPLFSYIEKVAKIKTKFVYEKDYAQIIKKFQNNTIDIALLGPLPYLKLDAKFKHNQPIITFKQKDGNPYYRCVLTKFGKDTLDFDKKIKVALTQPYSTCGYFMTSQLLQEKYNIDLQKQKYDYSMSHFKALEDMLEGDFLLAGAKEDIAREFYSLGVRVIAKSKDLPGFTLVVNTNTVSKEQIQVIQNLILTIPKRTYSHWDGIVSYGFEKADKSIFDDLKVDFDTIPMVGNVDEK